MCWVSGGRGGGNIINTSDLCLCMFFHLNPKPSLLDPDRW